MQKIIIQKPYEFIAPHRGTWWPTIIQRLRLYDIYLKRTQGIATCEIRHGERFAASLRAGHGIMLTPNHARPADPVVLGWLARPYRTHLYAMASWHLFNQDRFTGWAIHKMGAFSVNREAVDRRAIDTAIQILASAERPLILFPEGAVSRTNDRLNGLLDGVSFIARNAARQRQKRGDGGQVVVHPVAIKYRFRGNLPQVIEPSLRAIEERFAWRPQSDRPLLERIRRIGFSLLTLKELEYLGRPQTGTLQERLQGLINHLLHPIEEEWCGGPQEGPVVPRIKAIRMKLLPDLIQGGLSDHEKTRRWHQLADLYLTQQVASYPPDYLSDPPSIDRLLETVERYEEDLTDRTRVRGKLHAIIEVGEAIPVAAERLRNSPTDPLMRQIEETLGGMLDTLARESPAWTEEGATCAMHS